MEQEAPPRTIFFISDGTAISAETLGQGLISQFEGLHFRKVRLPFVTTAARAHECVAELRRAAARDGVRPIVIATLVDPAIAEVLREADALFVNFFETFIAPLEQELGRRSSHTIGRLHSTADRQQYFDRMEAINYAIAHDDGMTANGLEQAEVVLVGVSRSGKTPTSLYLALQYGIKAANYPLVPEDFERGRLPGALERPNLRLYGLTITPERLHEIRTARRPGSRYAALDNCRYELDQAQRLMHRHGIRCFDSTTRSIEEIAALIMATISVDPV